jgi:3-oxoadipate enol-lactonase
MALDGNLHFERGGPAGAPTLLLVHAMGADLAFWADCRTIWEERYDCIALDIRGVGGSPASDVPLSPQDHAQDLAAFCDRHGLESAIAIGCAVGAMMVAALAARRPDLVEALVLSNPGHRIVDPGRTALAARASAARDGGMTAIIPAATDAAFLGQPDDARKAAYVARFAAQNPAAYARQIEGMLDADISGDLDAITCPTLIIAGGMDRLLPAQHAEAIHAGLAGSTLVRFEDGAHFIPYQQPARFAHTVMDFLAESGQRA